MNHLLSALFLVYMASLISCGRSGGEARSIPAQGQLSAPTLLPLVDGACSEGLQNLDNHRFVHWDGEDFLRSSFNESWSSGTTLKSKLVDQVLYGYQEVVYVTERCRDSDDVSVLLSNQCFMGAEITSLPRRLKICDEKRYPRKSIESSALSVAGALDRFEGFLSDMNLGIDPLPVSVLLLPDVRIDKQDGQKVLSLTDNAAWVLSEKFTSVPAYIAIYPPSEDYEESGRPPFWEIPWIVSHEYGHHLFYNLIPDSIRLSYGYLAKWRRGRSLHQNWFIEDAKQSYENQVSLSAINEGFSDLLAHYVSGNKSLQITNLTCQFYQRDPSHGDFNNGQPKTFDYIANGFSSNFCDRVGFGEVHALGSILSFFTDKYMEIYGLDDPIKKGRIVIQTLQTFFQILEEDKSLENSLMEAYVVALHKVMLEKFGGLSPKHCSLLDDIFSNVFTLDQMSLSISESCSKSPAQGSLAIGASGNVVPAPF